MRIDHHAYQRAASVAGVGFLLQALFGLTLLIFGLIGRDTPFVFASILVLLGLVVWAALFVLFLQHKQERLEALEEDELSAGRPEVESVFERAEDEIRPAAKRLRRMYTLILPGASLLLIGLLVGIAIVLRGRLRGGMDDATVDTFSLTGHPGWAVAISLGFSAAAFIFSRFVAGMAKQRAWQNLRGGAAWMVGVSLVTLALAVGIAFRFFENAAVARGVAVAITIFMIVLAVEIAFNFILNLYRPRIPGEDPRPAFDSRLLSFFTAPDNIVRTINDAVNYQFGFDITSSWGYQLLLRSFTALIVTAIAVVAILNTIVVVEPNQQAVKLGFGKLLSTEPIQPGVTFKLPWPFQTAERFEVTTVRELSLTARQRVAPDVQLFTDDLSAEYDTLPDPFIVRASAMTAAVDAVAAETADDGSLINLDDDEERSDEEQQVIENRSLIDMELVMRYRIRPDGGLMDWLTFVPDSRRRRARMGEREATLKSMALQAISRELMQLSFDEVMTTRRAELPTRFRNAVQASVDARSAGVEVLGVDILMIRPPGETAAIFEEYAFARQNAAKTIAQRKQQVEVGYVERIGDRTVLDELLAAIDAFRAAESDLGDLESDPTTNPEALRVATELRDSTQANAERILRSAGGEASQTIARAEADRLLQTVAARTQAMEVAGQALPYRAAPELYRQIETMRVYSEVLPSLRKYILTIDPSRVDVDFSFKTVDELLQIQDAIGDSGANGS